MENWQIGRAQETGLNLVDLRTENLIDMIRRLVWDLQYANEWSQILEDAKEFLEHYDEFNFQATN